MAISANSKKIIEYLQAHNGENLTAQDVADALDLTKAQVNGGFTSAIQNKEYGVRVPGEVTNMDGTHDKVKFLKLTEAGMALNVNDMGD